MLDYGRVGRGVCRSRVLILSITYRLLPEARATESSRVYAMTEPTDFVYNVIVIFTAPSPGDDYVWTNRHQITADAGLLGDQARLEDLAGTFATYHTGVLFSPFKVDRVVISTYGPDLPWPPGFASIPVNLAGVLSPDSFGEVLPLECVLLVRRNVARGRDGKFFLRGALTRNTVDRYGNVTSNLLTLISQRSANLLSALESLDVQMVMASGPIAAIQTRQVVSLEPVNFRTLQFRTRRKSAIRRYQLTQFLQSVLSTDELSQAWDLLDDLGVNQSPLLPPPSS